MKYFTLYSFLLFWGMTLVACNNDKQETAAETEDTVQITAPQKPAQTKLIANIDYLRLRSLPGTDSETLAMLKEGDEMYDLGEVSDFSTAVELRGVQYNEPWLKVKTEAGQTGWVYGGGVYFDVNESSEAVSLLLKKRLAGFLGKDLAQEIGNYQTAIRNANTDKKLATAYRQGVEITAKIHDVFENKFPEPSTFQKNKQPDLRWLETSMPLFHLGSAAEGTVYHFYQDYKAFQKKAKKTKGSADDDFVELKFLLFDQDSLEYFFPSYFMQTWDYGGHSLLGEGKHLKILKKANEILANNPSIFDKEINEIKNALIHDMTASPEGYWYEKSKILSEFDAVLRSELGILTKKDLIALNEQRKRLENPQVSNIKVNIRSGINQ